VVLGVPEDELDADDPFGPHQALLDDVVKKLGERRHEVPGPVVHAPFDVIVAAASRDVAADLREPPVVRDDPEQLVQNFDRYLAFLGILHESRPLRRAERALSELLRIASVDDARAVFAEFPELRDDVVRERLEHELELAETDEERRIARARIELVSTATERSIDEAWEHYEQALLEVHDHYLAPRVRALLDDLRAEEAGDPARAMVIGDELLGLLLYGMEQSGVRLETLLRTASACYQAGGPGLEDRLDHVIALCQDALDLIAIGLDDDIIDPTGIEEERIRALLNMGATYARRLRGDPAANQERACALARKVLEVVSFDSDPRVWAMASTNLGMSLVHRAKERANEDPTRRQELEEAQVRFGDALRWRSFERDPYDWAFTQMGLGLALAQGNGASRHDDLRAAISHHQDSARGMAAAGFPELEAQACHNVASEAVVLLGVDDISQEERDDSLLDVAETACMRSLTLRPADIDPVGAGQTRSVLADVQTLRGDIERALDTRRAALDGLRPETAPHAARREALTLARLAEAHGDRETAADAYDIAAQAAIAALDSRADTAGRFEELETGLNLFRWAAGALLATGRVRRAVEVLEQGRGRELAAWLRRESTADELRRADPKVHDRLLSLQKQLDHHEDQRRSGAPVDLVAAATVQEELSRTIQQIRATQGFERFLLPPRFEDIAGSVPAGEALVYVLSVPDGSYAVIVSDSGEAEAIAAPELTSERVARELMRADQETETIGGYLMAQATGERLDEEIGVLSALLGPGLLRPLAERLAEMEVETLCLVPAGLLGRLPLSALTWDSGRCLTELFDIVVAPSALARDICRHRAADRSMSPDLLVAVGNPLPSAVELPWSEREAQMVAELMNAPNTVLLLGGAATPEAVAEVLASASHVHLACHGSAAVSPEALDAGLYFADDEPLTAADLLALGPMTARLIVASACETGVVPGYEAIDEALSLGTVLLGAGAAGVITSLWPVNDFATALLMSKLYEELVGGATPARALRVATLWVRSLPFEDALAYAEARPALRRHADQSTNDSPYGYDPTPFSAPSLWAAFHLSGA
jgi:CHAT domain-containing protein